MSQKTIAKQEETEEAKAIKTHRDFIGATIEIRSENEYLIMLGALVSIGASIWPWHKGYKEITEEDKNNHVTHHLYGWEPRGIMKQAGMGESSSGTFKSVHELLNKIRKVNNVENIQEDSLYG